MVRMCIKKPQIGRDVSGKQTRAPHELDTFRETRLFLPLDRILMVKLIYRNKFHVIYHQSRRMQTDPLPLES